MPKSCSRPGCAGRAVARLSYAYALSRVEVNGIGGELEPGDILLCQTHLDRLTLPKGWTLVANELPQAVPLLPTDMETLAAKIRRVGGIGDGVESGVRPDSDGTEFTLSNRANLVTLTARAHLRVVADATRYNGHAG